MFNFIPYFKKKPILHEYIINNRLLRRFSNIKDLGFTFDTKLIVKDHIQYIIIEASYNL